MREANQQLVLAALREQALAETSETARLRAVFLAEASRLLTEVFDPAGTLQRVAQLAVPAVGDVCMLDVIGADGEIERAGWARAGAAQEPELDAGGRFAPPADWRTNPEWRGHPVIEALITGAPVVVPQVTAAWVSTVTTGAEHFAFLRSIPLGALMTVPMIAAGRTVGAMTIGFTAQSGRGYTPDALTLAQDLAGRAALAVDSARLYRELQQAVRIREDFLASAGHDLRSPLTVIRGHAQLLRRQIKRSADQINSPASEPLRPLLDSLTPSLNHIEAATTKMGRLIGALLDAARIQAGQALSLDTAPTDVVALARRVAAEHQLSAERHQISVETGEGTLVGEWDADRLERMLDNLVGNAVKYSPDGGRIVLTLTRAGDTGVTGTTGGAAILTVADEGVGIPEADLPHVFERFHRGANVTGRIEGGGIGLADVSQVVKEHGGAISVESRAAAGASGEGVKGSGTTFTVRLPLAR